MGAGEAFGAQGRWLGRKAQAAAHVVALGVDIPKAGAPPLVVAAATPSPPGPLAADPARAVELPDCRREGGCHNTAGTARATAAAYVGDGALSHCAVLVVSVRTVCVTATSRARAARPAARVTQVRLGAHRG